jgi:septum site-determining protein MinC
MAIETVRTTRTSFDLKSASLPVVAVVLKTTDTAVLIAELALRMAEAPGFFDNDPVLIDLGPVREDAGCVDFPVLIALLRSHRTVPVAVRGGNAAQMEAAFAAGLTAAPEAAPVRTGTDRSQSVAANAANETPPAQRGHALPAAPAAPEALELPEVPAVILGTVVIDKPLRSGQQVYARGADLIVLSMVSFGAEVIADGNIHVYAPLRGRAIAGARGNINARIFSTCMEPQLVSIAGIYRTTEVAISTDILGKTAQVRLDGEKLLIERL